MVIGTVTAFQAGKLLDGARLALTALRQDPAGPRRNQKVSPKVAEDKEPANSATPENLPLSSMISSD
jgi:hypothetical protein